MTTRRPMMMLALAVSAALVGAPGFAHEEPVLPVSKSIATAAIFPAPGGTEADLSSEPASVQSTDPQPSEGWTGTTVTGQGLTGTYDVHEFDVLPGFKNDLMTVSISWDKTGHLAYDYDLYLDFLNPLTGQWEQALVSGASNYVGLDGPVESVRYAAPDVGRYRARVSNYLSTQQTYSGTVSFQAVQSPAPVGDRAFADRPDTSSSPKIHVIYFVPSDQPDESLDTNGVLSGSLIGMNKWFKTETGREYRLDTYLSNGVTKVDITFVRGDRARSAYSFGTMTSELEAKGFASPASRKRYMVFAALATSYCGIASYPLADETGYAQWAATMLDSPPGCRARQFGNALAGSYSEVITAQELMHNEGIVSLAAPHTCGPNYGHVCTAQVMAQTGNLDPESYDVMFPYVGRPLSQKQVDIGDDDYYRHSLPYRDFDDSPFLG